MNKTKNNKYQAVSASFASKASKFLLVSFFVFLGIFTLAGNSEAANLYIRDGATGSSCTGWGLTAACDALSTAVSVSSAGDTIYVAAGNYNSIILSKSLTIRKATTSNHGSDIDWNNIYASQATFTGEMEITADNVTIDGQYRDDNNWKDDTAYGFKLTSTGGLEGIKISGADYTTIKYMAIDPGDNAIYAASGAPSYGKLQYTYLYNCGRTNVLARGISYWLFEYNYFGRSGLCYPAGCPTSCGPCNQHSEAFSVAQGSSNYNTIRYNYVIDFNSTGGLMFEDSNYTFVYGNIFRSQYDFAANGVIGSWSSGISTNWRIYNNTFIDTPDNVQILNWNATFTGSIVRNNLFYNNLTESIGTSGVTLSHNASDGTNFGGANNQTDITDIFVSRASSDYRLKAPTNSGYTLSNENVGELLHTYNIDMLGNTRGADGVWDRGAYEYVSGSAPSIYTLTVVKSGTGSGTITGTGIDCGSDCAETINTGTSVTLTASPDSDSVFLGWSGAGCSGTGTCTVTMNSNTTVTASFNQPETSVNLLTNSDFESGFTSGLANGWQMTTDGNVAYSVSQDTGHQGSGQKITVTTPGSWGLFFYQTPSFELNQSYTWSFWYKAQEGDLWAQITNGPATQVVFQRELPGTNGEWQQATYTFQYNNSQAPQLRFSSNTAGTYWLDDIQLVVGADATPPAAPTGLSVQ